MTEKKMNKQDRLQAAREKALAIDEADLVLLASNLAVEFDLTYSEAKQIVWEPYYGCHLSLSI